MAERSTEDTIVMATMFGVMVLSAYFVITADPSVPQWSSG